MDSEIRTMMTAMYRTPDKGLHMTPSGIASAPDILSRFHRSLTDEQLHRFEANMAEIFEALGMDMGSEATGKTPQRFMNALLEATAGYEGDPKLMTLFESECLEDGDCGPGQIIEGPIEFYSLCEHHALPFFGKAYVGYIADDHILGLSKLTRLVRLFARRFTVQERLGQQIANAMVEMLAPRGVAVYLEANHLCIQMRGVQESAPLTRTTVWRGSFRDDASLRAEFLSACHSSS
jgi:GTP cyclohydrolase I